MATSSEAFGGREVSVGRVMSRAFEVMRANPVTVFGITLLLGGLPQLLFGYLISRATVNLQSGAGMSSLVAASGGGGLVALVLSALAQGALVRATVGHDRGERPEIGTCLAAGLAVALPLIGLSLILAIAVGIGFVLLLVPGIFLCVIWAVAAPALVAERRGIFAAFGRSTELTKGARWKVLGVGLLGLAIVYALSIALGLVMGPIVRVGQGTLPAFSLAASIANVLVATITTSVTAILPTSLYVELRRAKEGPGDARLADIFA